MESTTANSAAKKGHLGNLAELSIALVSGLALALTALFLCVVPLAGKTSGARDFVVYWATGQQLVHHANPYDRDAMMRIERSAGLAAGYGALFMRNPPWALPLSLPLGFVGLRIGGLVWSLILLACLLGSVRMLWSMHGRPDNQLPVSYTHLDVYKRQSQTLAKEGRDLNVAKIQMSKSGTNLSLIHI